MLSWHDKGCEVCRNQWEIGKHPPQIATNIARHAHLHRCNICGTFWEQNERFAEPISVSQARKLYPEALA